MQLKKFRNLLIFLICTMIFIGSYILAENVLYPKTAHGIEQGRNMYEQPKNTIDVAFMGSSHIHCDVNTAYLWEKYGIAGYDFSAAEQPLWITYYYIKELLKYQKPGVVVLDLYAPARFKADYQYNWLNDNLIGIRFSMNKINMLLASCELKKIPDYFPSIVTYHSRFSDITIEDWKSLLVSKKEKQAFKGYTPYFKVSEQDEPELDEKNSGGITVKSEIYLQKIIELSKEEGFHLYFIVSPYITTDEDELVYNRIHEIAQMNDIKFISTNYNYEEMGIRFDEDFNDESHLNYSGSCKFSDYLGAKLKEEFIIPDRRGDERWESWDRHAQTIELKLEG